MRIAEGALSIAAALALACSGSAAAAQEPVQARDESWRPSVADPLHPQGEGPRVVIDGGHGNFHRIDGRFAPFAELLGADGFRVSGSEGAITSETLAATDILVIANAIAGGEDAEWHLPVPSAFAPAEIAALERWVRDGGSLLLIADHMPFPGAAERLAEAFGIVFVNGFARTATDEGTMTFSRGDSSLADHPVTAGRGEGEAVPAVTSFAGQGFRAVVPVEPLMRLPDDGFVLLPSEAWAFAADTPRISSRGLLQGAVLRHGRGRVAVFGEAAMFTAQAISHGDGEVMRFGINSPDAPHNAQFVLNVLHWLAGALEPAAAREH